jgi:HEAT repeat protein
MLEGLEDIDWRSLSHAYGAATDVPDQLRALASPNEERRSAALHELYGNIWHQGTVYQATSYAVPFLVALLQEREVLGKCDILGLLQAISRGNSYLEVHQDLEWYRHERRTLQEQIREELVWVRKAKQAVSSGVPVFLRLLSEGSPKVRVWSAYVLANCTDRHREVYSALRRALQRERHSLARASLVWAVVSLHWDAMRQGFEEKSSVSGTKRALIKLVRSATEKPIVRLLTCFGMMQFLPEKEYPRCAHFCAKMLGQCPRGLAELPFTEGEPIHFAYRVLAHQRSLVLDLFTSIVQIPNHPFREDTTYYLEEIVHAQPRSRPKVALLLGRLLDSENSKVRQHTARLLGLIGSSRHFAKESLVKALNDPDPEVTIRAAQALSKIGDTRAVPFLQDRLVRGDTHDQLLHAIKRFGRDAKATIPQLRNLVRHGKGNTQILAAHALGLMGEDSSEALSEVTELLWNNDAGAGAGWALMLWGPLAKEAIPRILDFLESAGAASSARLNAIKAIGSMGVHARPALGTLNRLLSDTSPEIRVAAAATLWAVAPRAEHVVSVIEAVLRGCEGQRPINQACTSALEALESIGPAGRSARPLVERFLNHSYQWHRIHAARALWRMGEPVHLYLPVLIDELRCRPVGLLSAECLAEIGPPAAAALPRLREILGAERGLSEGGLADECIDQEEEFLKKVAVALQAIEGNS